MTSLVSQCLLIHYTTKAEVFTSFILQNDGFIVK